MAKISFTLDGKTVQAEEGTNLLEFVRAQGIHLPGVCYEEGKPPIGRCRMCVVEIGGFYRTACTVKTAAGLVVRTDTPELKKMRAAYEKLLGAQKLKPKVKKFVCVPSQACGILSLDRDKCILCGACVRACNEQDVNSLAMVGRGGKAFVQTEFDKPIDLSRCVLCGKCSLKCPVAAINERDDTRRAFAALAQAKKEGKIVVAETAPSIRVAIGEEFGFAPGTRVTGKMVAALRRLGFDYVFDTDFGADLTIMEEASELKKFLGKRLVVTSCCPGWILVAEKFYPELLPALSTCKSPQAMTGAMIKSYWAKKKGIDPKRVVVVSILPCVAKKFEADRPELANDGLRNVDVALTTREFGAMLKEKKIDFAALPDEEFDDMLGVSSGGGAIFGVTGGVTEAALRMAFPKHSVEFKEVRGFEGIKTAEIKDASGGAVKARVAIAHGVGNARALLDKVAAGKEKFDFIEIMACEGGCAGGGGQPRPTTKSVIQARIRGLYSEDEGKKVRRPQDNPSIKAVYADFLGEPLGERSHEYLHTHFRPRRKK
jgi:NADH-quinone oxidoreductase subunit G/NADP-reducing hydrogenase subunit HndD